MATAFQYHAGPAWSYREIVVSVNPGDAPNWAGRLMTGVPG